MTAMNKQTIEAQLGFATDAERWQAVATARPRRGRRVLLRRARPPASIAGRPARRAWRGPRTSRSTDPRRRPSAPASARASAAGPTSRARAERTPPPVARACRADRGGRGAAARSTTLAARGGLSPYHFHRVFKAVDRPHAARPTPRRSAPARARGAARRRGSGDRGDLRCRLQLQRPLLRRRRTRVLGMTPTRFRAGGAGRDDPLRRRRNARWARSWSPQSDKGVCAIMLGDDPDALVRDLQDRFPKAELIGGDAAFEALVAQVVGFVEAPAARPRPAARHARHGLPAARLAGAARDPAGQDGELRRDRQRDRRARTRCARWRRPARPTRSPSRSPATAWCAATARSSGYRWGVERKRALLDREARPSRLAALRESSAPDRVDAYDWRAVGLRRSMSAGRRCCPHSSSQSCIALARSNTALLCTYT